MKKPISIPHAESTATALRTGGALCLVALLLIAIVTLWAGGTSPRDVSILTFVRGVVTPRTFHPATPPPYQIVSEHGECKGYLPVDGTNPFPSATPVGSFYFFPSTHRAGLFVPWLQRSTWGVSLSFDHNACPNAYALLESYLAEIRPWTDRYPFAPPQPDNTNPLEVRILWGWLAAEALFIANIFGAATLFQRAGTISARTRHLSLRQQRICIHCGYSLHGIRRTTCPECGGPQHGKPTRARRAISPPLARVDR